MRRTSKYWSTWTGRQLRALRLAARAAATPVAAPEDGRRPHDHALSVLLQHSRLFGSQV